MSVLSLSNELILREYIRESLNESDSFTADLAVMAGQLVGGALAVGGGWTGVGGIAGGAILAASTVAGLYMDLKDGDQIGALFTLMGGIIPGSSLLLKGSKAALKTANISAKVKKTNNVLLRLNKELEAIKRAKPGLFKRGSPDTYERLVKEAANNNELVDALKKINNSLVKKSLDAIEQTGDIDDILREFDTITDALKQGKNWITQIKNNVDFNKELTSTLGIDVSKVAGVLKAVFSFIDSFLTNIPIVKQMYNLLKMIKKFLSSIGNKKINKFIDDIVGADDISNTVHAGKTSAAVAKLAPFKLVNTGINKGIEAVKGEPKAPSPYMPE